MWTKFNWNKWKLRNQCFCYSVLFFQNCMFVTVSKRTSFDCFLMTILQAERRMTDQHVLYEIVEHSRWLQTRTDCTSSRFTVPPTNTFPRQPAVTSHLASFPYFPLQFQCYLLLFLLLCTLLLPHFPPWCHHVLSSLFWQRNPPTEYKSSDIMSKSNIIILHLFKMATSRESFGKSPFQPDWRGYKF